MQNKATAAVKPFVYVAVGVAAIGGLLFGYDTGVISGAILFIKKQFSLSSTMEELVVSAVLAGAVLGAILGGALTDRFGRRKVIILAGIIFTASAIGTALAPTVAWLIAGRVVSGVAIGIASFLSPMYIAELAPARVRGALVAVNMVAIATGIVVAYLADYALSASQGWRSMFGLAAIPSVALVIGMWPLPDSPRWLISRSKVQEATQALKRVRTETRRQCGNRGHPAQHDPAKRRLDAGASPAHDPNADDRRRRPRGLSADYRYQHRHVLLPYYLQVRRDRGCSARDPSGSRFGSRDVVFLCVGYLPTGPSRPQAIVTHWNSRAGLRVWRSSERRSRSSTLRT